MKVKAQVRESHGRRSCQSIRKQGFYPAVVYGKKTETASLQVNMREWDAFFRTHAVRSQPFEMELEGKTLDVLVRDIKRSTATQKVEHIDFYTIERNKPIVVSVPLRYTNQDESVGLKAGGLLNQHVHDIEISALPKAIPSSIEVDITELEMGSALHVSDINLPKGCTLVDEVSEEYNPQIVSISEPRAEEPEPEVEAEEGEASEGESEGEEAPSEGESEEKSED